MEFESLGQEKQTPIVNAACEVFARHGFEKASMRDIAEKANVSKSVLFKYFSTKENLYRTIFRLASDKIAQVDAQSASASAEGSDMFTLMRRSAKARMALFKDYPWIFQFSYTAAFDGAPFAKDLFRKELAKYRKANRAIMRYEGLRPDVSPETARQLIFWVSQGYLEDRLNRGEIEPEGLESGFEKWVGILELLLKGEESNE